MREPALSIAIIVLSMAYSGCGARGPARSVDGNGGGDRSSVLHVGPYGELSVDRREGGPSADGPHWLHGLQQGDTLVYRVRSAEGREQTARMRVVRLIRRGHGVAARLEPNAEVSEELRMSGYWLAGDDTGLYSIEAHGLLMDPGFVPLDRAGRVIPQGRTDARWRIPPEWADLDDAGPEQRVSLDLGWVVDELEMTLDGPVRGDSCARISKSDRQEVVRLSVCANIGLVEFERGSPDALANENWRLIANERTP